METAIIATLDEDGNRVAQMQGSMVELASLINAVINGIADTEFDFELILGMVKAEGFDSDVITKEKEVVNHD
ncbi:hypothetical protein [Periweissella ghanensis]|uniref:Uncharacterized protein n=1 Tax=Periweissella ghanensis TaxID=467997 RepID=A0ABM8ZD62_9LACO|nr:hypothetical protein [Periweissella ghanensis]MCM0600334.1 hypothetical protein [Periweissella ghanensis]CAH0419247.1 hypothetical protein WGH24286_01694 [Periweissella ghanensis]